MAQADFLDSLSLDKYGTIREWLPSRAVDDRSIC